MTANVQQIEDWNEAMGRTWAQMHERLDRQLAPIGRAAMAAARLTTADRVLDIGCGCGETTLELAGKVAGVAGADVSAQLVEIAQAAARDAGATNVGFTVGDAQVHPFPPAAFDVIFSRFGVMFFDDPRAAFINLRKALKSGGRLAFCCWRNPAENLWLSLPMRAAGHLLPPMPPADPQAPGPFAFSDPDRVRAILSDAGFADVTIEKLDLRTGGESLEESVVMALRMGQLGSALRQAGADEALKRKVEEVLREALAAYVEDDVVKLPAAAWIVSAHNPGGL